MDVSVRQTLKKEFRTLRLALGGLDKTLKRLSSPNGVAQRQNGIPRRRVRLSAKARASLVLQGRYMGYMRQLKPRQKAQVRKLKAAKGVRAAIAQARRLSS
jgi:hypothetical protein